MAENPKEITIGQLPKKGQIDPFDDLIITSSVDGSSARISAQDIADQVAEVTKDIVIAEAAGAAQGYNTAAQAAATSAINAAASAASEYEDKGVYNALTNTPALTANSDTGKTGTKEQKYTVETAGPVAFAGRNFIAGTVLNAREELRGNGGQWYRVPAGQVLLDPRKSPNLILSANNTPENWMLNTAAANATQPALFVQTQPAVMSTVKNAKGLGFMHKFVMQPSSRINFFSNRIGLDTLQPGEKVHLGYYRYLSTGTVLAAATSHKLWPLPENTDSNIAMEVIELGAGLQYVRSINPITVPAFTSTVEVRIFWYIASTSIADGELWFGAPALVKTSVPLVPLMYQGGEDLSTIPDPKSSQNLFAFANLSPDKISFSAATGDVPNVYRQSGVIESITTVKNFRQFPYAIKATNVQVNSRINLFSQSIKILETVVPGTQVVLGFFLFVGPGVNISQVTCSLVDKTNVGISGATFSMEFLDMGNGLRYYRSARPASFPTFTSNEVVAGIYIYTGSTSTTGDIYVMSPALVKSSYKLQPQMYLGQEDITGSIDLTEINSKIATNTANIETANGNISALQTRSGKIELSAERDRNNYIKDAGFAAQEIGSTVLGSPWGFSGFSSLTHFQAPIVFELVADGPSGTKAMKQQHSKRSSDGKLSHAALAQIVTIPAEHLGMSKFSYSFWMKRDSLNVNPLSFQLQFFPNLEDTTGSTTFTPALPTLSTVLNAWSKVKFEDISVPAGTKRINIKSAFATPSGSTEDVISNIWIQTYEVAFNSSIANASGLNYKAIDPDFFGLKGKKMCMYGDSIVAADVSTSNVLQNEALAIFNKFGMTMYVRGVGGTRVVDNGSIAWFNAEGLYLARPDNGGTKPAGSFEWQSSMSALERINNTIPADTDIIFIRGLTNDYLNTPLGTIDSAHDQTTVYGAYLLMLDRIYARIPNAIVILATPTHRNGEDTAVGTGATAGLKFEQVRDVVRNIARVRKYILCETGDAGINQLNHATFLSDGIHPNAEGYNRMNAVTFKVLKSLIAS